MRTKANWYWAIPLIVVGLTWQLRNLEYISSQVSHIIISWQSLLIYIGVIHLFRKRYVGGLLEIFIGCIFMLPLAGVLEYDWFHLNWPIFLILVGLFVLLSPYLRRNVYHHESNVSYSCEEGYVETTNYFGSVKQIVLDPIFKGARISNTFGGTVIDLRRTVLDAPETYIDIECTFGGIEIYLPSNWSLLIKSTAVLGGCEDKRFPTEMIDNGHVLIIRGNVTFGGVVFKS